MKRISNKGSIIKMGMATAGLLMLAGCVTTSETVSPTERKITEGILFAGTTPLPAQKDPQREYGCPAASILDGTAAYRVGDQSARGVSHQASIHDLARECKAEGNMMRIKIGVQGRLILGDSGKPGTYTVPVRVAVRGNGQTVVSKMLPAQVTIPSNDTQAPFVLVDESITVPITAEDPGEVYSVLIGLDPQGGRQTGGKKKRQR